MKLEIEYLKARHTYWKNRIGETSIWDPDLFSDITIVIRPKGKTYEGLFQRRRSKSRKKLWHDRIFIYNNCDDFDINYLDSLLVHEMIHQYIIQNNIKDTSSHGRIFRSFMKKINAAFPKELNISISGRNPDIPRKGEGQQLHTLLVLKQKDNYFCCIVNPAKKRYFDNYLSQNKSSLRIDFFDWYKSNDLYFSNFRRCTTRLHGIRIPLNGLDNFCKEYNLQKEIATTESRRHMVSKKHNDSTKKRDNSLLSLFNIFRKKS